MYALLDKSKKLIGVSADKAELEALKAQLKIDGDVLPATFGDDPGKVKLNVTWKLEKFDGDEQSPETLVETIEGEG